MKYCESCQREAERIRKGLCDACYYEEYTGRSKKPYCECCGWKDRRALVRKRLDRENWSTLCGNCSTIAGRRVMTLDDLKGEVVPSNNRRQGERRAGDDRRDLSRPRREEPDQRDWPREDEEPRRKDEERRK